MVAPVADIDGQGVGGVRRKGRSQHLIDVVIRAPVAVVGPVRPVRRCVMLAAGAGIAPYGVGGSRSIARKLPACIRSVLEAVVANRHRCRVRRGSREVIGYESQADFEWFVWFHYFVSWVVDCDFNDPTRPFAGEANHFYYKLARILPPPCGLCQNLFF
mgnify:CR=1 FL=1